MNWFWLYTQNGEEGCHWMFWFVTEYTSPSAGFSNWFGKFSNVPQSRIGPFQFSSVWPVRNAVRGCRFAEDEVKEAVYDPLHNQQQTYLFSCMKSLQIFGSLYGEFIHSIGMCRMQQFLAILRSFFHSSMFCTLSIHHFPVTSLLSSLTSSCHLFLGLRLSLGCFQIHM